MKQSVRIRYSKSGQSPLPTWLPVVLMATAAALGLQTGGAGLGVGEWVLGTGLSQAVAAEAAETDFETASGPRIAMRECTGATQRFCVLDGETIRFDGEDVALADIEAPEVRRAHCSAERSLGKRAKRRLAELLSEASFELLEPDGPRREVTGRKLRVAMREGRSLGAILIAEGLARPWTGHDLSWC